MLDDWAIVVGVRRYPGISNLDGSENDARDFAAWLADPNGGDVPGPNDTRVPESHIKLILSSNFPDPNDAASAEPTHSRVEQAFEWLDDIAEENRKQGNGRTVGRRLYLYFSGHGYAPSKDDAALLMANATPRRIGNHIAGRAWAEWFHNSGYFQEIALFMDCCRDSYTTVAMRPAHLNQVLDTNNIQERKRFYAFGTQWDRKAWEKVTTGDNKPHGIFTTALLSGLRGLAADPQTGEITAGSLRAYLYQNMKGFLSEKERDNPDIGKEPYIDDQTSPANPMLFGRIAPAAVQKFTVRLHIPASAVGTDAKVFDGSDDTQPVAYAAQVGSPWQVELTKGLYEARLANGSTTLFKVRATTEAQDVRFA